MSMAGCTSMVDFPAISTWLRGCKPFFRYHTSTQHVFWHEIPSLQFFVGEFRDFLGTHQYLRLFYSSNIHFFLDFSLLPPFFHGFSMKSPQSSIMFPGFSPCFPHFPHVFPAKAVEFHRAERLGSVNTAGALRKFTTDPSIPALLQIASKAATSVYRMGEKYTEKKKIVCIYIYIFICIEYMYRIYV